MKIKIREGLEIGDDCPTFIIAEVGSNWRTLDDCLLSIKQAKLCGADAVKFQLYDHEALYGLSNTALNREALLVNYGIEKSKLPLEWLPKLKNYADKHGIEFMCSAFSPELIDAVDSFVNIHKLASAELTHIRMLEKLRKIGKPLFMSTGGHGLEDIKHAQNVFQHPDYPGRDLVIMYCVSAYPAHEIELNNIGAFRDIFEVPIGYSDHSLDISVIPMCARSLGACIIEKHFTAFPEFKVPLSEFQSPDGRHSLTPSQFKTMVDSIRGNVDNCRIPSPEESEMILRHNRRLIATRDIGVGDAFTESFNFGIYRSLKDDTHAFSPWMVNEIQGRPAKREIRAGDGIGPGDV